MYDEFERAVTGRAPRGLHPLAWLGIALALLVAAGAVVVGFAVHLLATRTDRLAERMERVPAAVAAMVAHHLVPRPGEILSADPQEGLRILGNMDARALASGAPSTGRLEGFLEIRSGEGGEVVRIGAGAAAGKVPEWVPLEGEVPELRPVFSLTSQEGSLGAVAWDSGESPEGTLARYRERLEAEGFDLRAEHRVRHRGHRQASLWARHQARNRLVFLVACTEEGLTRVLLGYGEGG